MHSEYHKWWSPALRQDMEIKVYGHAGKPVVVFPTSGGRFYEYEDFGMVEICRPFLEEGRMTLFAVDSVDQQSWMNLQAHPSDRARRHNEFDRYIVDEVCPFIRDRRPHAPGFMAHGCSLGASHSVNFFLRHPDIFDSVVALSGVYTMRCYVGDAKDEVVYFNTPLAYLPGLHDPWFLERYRRSQIVVCVGQGAWEEECLADTRELDRLLREKGVPAWIDFWGHDVNHDWPWWRKMMPYFLGHVLPKLGY